MSTFGGTIDELPGLCMDRFTGINVNASIFFLSHFHSDHMHGFCEILSHLKRNQLKFYSHEITTTFLRNKNPWFKECFEYLPLNTPTVMNTPDDFVFSVTLLPAGHCPGSVMFLFETDKHNILYTGDFRLSVNEFKNYKGLYTSQGVLKRINKVHLDTTFMLKRYEQFPTREESLDAICKLIGEWLEKDNARRIDMVVGHYYGSEFLIIQIYKRFDLKVHVSQQSYDEFYKYIPIIEECVTTSNSAQIHLNCAGYQRLCISAAPEKTRIIRATALNWTEWTRGQDISTGYEFSNFCKVCISAHASLEEIQGILKFLKPEHVEANSEPNDYLDRMEMLSLIDECIDGNSPIKRSPMKKLEINNKYFDLSKKTKFTSGDDASSSSNSDNVDKKGKMLRNSLSDDEDDEDEDEEYRKLNAAKARKMMNEKGVGKRLEFDLTVFDL